MLYLTTPLGGKRAMFEQAAAVGASEIRLDIELSGVFPSPTSSPDWSGVDQYMSLARRYHLRVLADLTATPWYMVACPPGTPAGFAYWTCPTSDPKLWGREAGEIAAHTRGVIDDFEIINEPDGRWAFVGTPRQYAAVLSCAYDSIHAPNPTARVALGGVMDPGPGGIAWTEAMLATPGVDAAHKFDIANIHVRVPQPAAAGRIVRDWRQYLARRGFRGPLWVTETGYPADPAFQTEPGYQEGPRSQARWMETAIDAMLNAGAAMVFATERDALAGRFASEGILQSADPLTESPVLTPRASFYALRGLAHRYVLTSAHPARHSTPTSHPARRSSATRAPTRSHRALVRPRRARQSGQTIVNPLRYGRSLLSCPDPDVFTLAREYVASCTSGSGRINPVLGRPGYQSSAAALPLYETVDGRLNSWVARSFIVTRNDYPALAMPPGPGGQYWADEIHKIGRYGSSTLRPS